MKPWWKEWVDQPLHMLMVVGLMGGAYFQWPLYAAVLFALFWMLLRELEQHEWSILRVGSKDLLFCLLACFLFCAAIFLLEPPQDLTAKSIGDVIIQRK